MNYTFHSLFFIPNHLKYWQKFSFTVLTDKKTKAFPSTQGIILELGLKQFAKAVTSKNPITDLFY